MQAEQALLAKPAQLRTVEGQVATMQASIATDQRLVQDLTARLAVIDGKLRLAGCS